MTTCMGVFLDPDYARAIGYEGLGKPIRQRRVIPPEDPRNRTLDVLSARYLLVSDAMAARRPAWFEGAAAPYGKRQLTSEIALLVRRSALSRVRFVESVQRVPGRKAALRALAMGRIDPGAVALVEPGRPLPPASPSPRCVAEGGVRAPGELDLMVHCPAEGFMVLAERAVPGWQATIDGVPAVLRRC